jgi:hypothetical protein
MRKTANGRKKARIAGRRKEGRRGGWTSRRRREYHPPPPEVYQSRFSVVEEKPVRAVRARSKD